MTVIRFCPNCETERLLTEMVCEGTIEGRPCQWDLSGVLPKPAGHARDKPRVAPTCLNGHAVSEGDVLCSVCGVDLAGDLPGEVAPQQITEIEGWTLGRRLASSTLSRERFLARRAADGRQAVLTLYCAGSEPDPAVYNVLRRLPRDHVPEIIATGRWEHRAFEVAEELTGGTLTDIGQVANDPGTVRRITEEIGLALHSFAEAGLRHRDLRPGTILVRTREPLDLVIVGFGSARLAEYDLDIVSPLETSRYMAPEAIAGGVAAASDWWSLGMILLEQVTRGACFEGVNDQAFLIHVLTNGVTLPADLDPSFALLLRGLLAPDRRVRWQWNEVKAWLAGETVEAPPGPEAETDQVSGPTIVLAGRAFGKPTAFALAAAEAANWDAASELLQRGVIATWTADSNCSVAMQAGIRQIAHLEGLSDDLRLSLALKHLNPSMPLVSRGIIITPGWLLDHPSEGYALITGPLPDLLRRLETEPWITNLHTRAAAVRERADHLGISLDEDEVRVHLLSTSQARLATLWDQRRRLLPDTDHAGLVSLVERRQTTAEDLILLLGAKVGQFRSSGEIVDEAEAIAEHACIASFDRSAAESILAEPRREIYRQVDIRLSGFARCGLVKVDEWADQFRLERRMPLARALALLAVPETSWQEPPKQEYVATLLDFFAKKVSGAILRGPLSRMIIGKSTPRISLTELGSERRPAHAILDQLLARSDQAVSIDPSVFAGPENTVERRLRKLYTHANLYRRDTGIDGLYLGFPFLLMRDLRGSARPRIAPVLLWPVQVDPEVGNRGHVSVAFDREREEVRLNPAFEGLMGFEAARKWLEAAEDLLGRATVTAAQAMDAFSLLAPPRSTGLTNLPGRDLDVEPGRLETVCSAVFFHAAYSGQAIAEDLRHLKGFPPAGTALETALRLSGERPNPAPPAIVPESDRYFTVDSDPSQEEAVMMARSTPGLIVEGPPGTGKSQTIVNMIGDAIARRRSLLVVCQKQPALEVVRKRLDAEGLSQRIVMVTDVNRDREPIVRAVREQVEAILARPHGVPGWRQERDRLAVRIESLEGDLDRHYEALHRTDHATGLSYRTLLSELITLEEGTRSVIDAPALRPILGKLNLLELASIEERCAPIAHYWLLAKYEDSPLSILKSFNPDKATVRTFLSDLRAFTIAEDYRKQITERAGHAFALEDPQPYRNWIARTAPTFQALDGDTWSTLGRWGKFFESKSDKQSRGEKVLSELAAIAANISSLPASSYDPRLSAIAASLTDGEQRDLTKAAASARSHPGFWRRLSPWRAIRRRNVRRFLGQHGIHDQPTPFDRVSEVFTLEAALRPLRRRVAAVVSLLVDGGALPLESLSVSALGSVVEAMTHALGHVQTLIRLLNGYPRPADARAVAASGSSQAFNELMATAEHSLALFDARRLSRAALEILAQWFDDSWLASRRQRIDQDGTNNEAIAALLTALPAVAPFQRFRIRAASLGEGDFEVLRLLRRSEAALETIPAEELETEMRRILGREARLAWKARIEAEQPILLFDDMELRSKIEPLGRADADIRLLNRQLLVEDVDAARLGSWNEWESITRLTGRRARRLREFIERGLELGLMAVRPVWLMNPDVASRVLPLKRIFDTIIYDEASQMPVEHALPTLFRGEVVVVSGDEKQMPPTSFFSSKVENDEADLVDDDEPEDGVTEEEREVIVDTWNRREIKDCPDLLQLARAVLPSAVLEVHYRSAYRELISFSNRCFYANRLNVPVQHSKDVIRAVRPIEFEFVNGLYSQQTNEVEARRVTAILANIWREPGPRPTIGVVTFNRKQADLIEDFLEEMAESDLIFRQALAHERGRVDHGEDVGFFVKNVENVQGDERDVIVFSTTFGRNEAGRFRRFFGVLGQVGGERRLNVAVTRARKKIVVISSMPIAEVSEMLSTQQRPARPRDYLQAYLEYARTLSQGDYESFDALLARLSAVPPQGLQRSGGAYSDGFSKAVLNFVTGLGWNADRIDNNGAFGVDLAIVDRRTGIYAIGIECDSPRHRILEHARAREIWRPRVLAGTFPSLHRVSSQGWCRERGVEQQRLKKAIEQSMAGRGLQ